MQSAEEPLVQETESEPPVEIAEFVYPQENDNWIDNPAHPIHRYLADDEFVYTVAELMAPLKAQPARELKYTDVPQCLMRFYEDDYYGHLKVNMQVDSSDGLKVRSSPDLGGQKIDVLPDNFIVTITALGELTVIDGIESAWVEIALPGYLRNGNDIEYGWVFGGYLKDYESKIPFAMYGSIPEVAGLCYDDWDPEPYYSFNLKRDTNYFIDKSGNSLLDSYFSLLKVDDVYINYLSDPEYTREQAILAAESDLLSYFPDILGMVNGGIASPSDSVRYDMAEVYWHNIQKLRQIYPACYREKALRQTAYAPAYNAVSDKTQDYMINEVELNGKTYYILICREKSYVNELMSYYKYDFYRFDGSGYEKLYTLLTEPDFVYEPLIYAYANKGRVYIEYEMSSILMGRTRDGSFTLF